LSVSSEKAWKYRINNVSGQTPHIARDSNNIGTNIENPEKNNLEDATYYFRSR